MQDVYDKIKILKQSTATKAVMVFHTANQLIRVTCRDNKTKVFDVYYVDNKHLDKLISYKSLSALLKYAQKHDVGLVNPDTSLCREIEHAKYMMAMDKPTQDKPSMTAKSGYGKPFSPPSATPLGVVGKPNLRCLDVVFAYQAYIDNAKLYSLLHAT